jgi:hypothetical protein
VMWSKHIKRKIAIHNTWLAHDDHDLTK